MPRHRTRKLLQAERAQTPPARHAASLPAPRDPATVEGAVGRALRTLPADVPDAEGRLERVLRHEGESPLAWLRRRKGLDGRPLLDDASFAAGERLRADLTRASLLPRVTSNWSGAGAGRAARGPAEATEAMVAARQRVEAASLAVGSDLIGLLVDVCGFLKGLEQVEQERRWPARSAKVVLTLALGRLAEHYGYHREVRGPDRSRGILSWTAPPT